MKISQVCSCGARVDVDVDQGLGFYLIDGTRRDSQGRMYRAEAWIDEWNARHLHCEPPTPHPKHEGE